MSTAYKIIEKNKSHSSPSEPRDVGVGRSQCSIEINDFRYDHACIDVTRWETPAFVGWVIFRE